jgi:CubicO group peptidase (beta-lactamase class C family)
MTPDMLFEVGSIGKTFVTTLLMQLVAWLARSWTVEDMLTKLVGKGQFPPGTRWRYSTTGFRLAREVLKLQTGKPIAELIQARLLDPLGIHGMWLTPTWPIPKNIKVAHEWYDLDGDTNLDDITAIPKTAFEDLKDAPVYSNALDLARFCQGLFHDRALVSHKSLAAMLDLRPVADPAEPMAAEYGLGVGVLRIPDLEGFEHYGHTGNGFGYVAAMLYLPRSQACVVLLTNDGGATMGAAAAPFLQVVDKGL